jgi:hypothetical protein
MAGITDEAKNAIKAKFNEVMQVLSLDDTLSVQDLHNIRKSLNNTIYLDPYGKSKKAP